MKRLDIAKMRVLNQGLLQPWAESPCQVVEWMGMVQAQDLEMALWAVGCRMRRPSRKSVVEALNRGELVRMHLARHTWQMVIAEDVRSLVVLYKDRYVNGIKKWAKTGGYEISDQMLAESEALLRQSLAGSRGMTTAEIFNHYKIIGIEDQRLVHFLLLIADVSGTICNGETNSRYLTYALLDEKVPNDAILPKKDTLARLADRYFRSHSPATLDDFVWWSGLNKSECRTGMEAIAERLTEIDGYYIHVENRNGRMQKNFAVFLPPYDELLIGYKSRHHTIVPEHRHHAHNNFGIFHPVILNGRQITGNWSRKNLTTSFFGEPICEEALEKALERYKTFLSCF